MKEMCILSLNGEQYEISDKKARESLSSSQIASIANSISGQSLTTELTTKGGEKITAAPVELPGGGGTGAEHTTMNVEIEDDGFGGYRADHNDSEINNHRNAGGLVQAKYSALGGQTYTYYYSTMESDRKPTFIRTYVENGSTVQVLASVGNDKKVTVVRKTATGAVESVNGKTGAVTLTAADVKALPDDTVIPTKLAQMTEDATHRTVTDADKEKWNAGGGGLTIVDSLPTANEENFNKGKLYLKGNEVAYMAREAVETPTVEATTALPGPRYGTSAAAVGTDIYVFGGYAPDRLSDIVKFDTKTQKATTLDVGLPTPRWYTSAAAVGTDIYVFGGSESFSSLDEIVKFDTVTQQISILSAKLPTTRSQTSAAAVGTDIYVFGGTGDSSLSDIVKFDTITQTVTKLSVGLPYERYATSAAAVGTDIYVFGGRASGELDEIIKFDTITQRVTTSKAKFPDATYGTSAVTVGSDIYVFGGSYWGRHIFYFDPSADTISQLSITLLDKDRYYASAAFANRTIYVFGGRESSVILPDIVKISFGYTYSYNHLPNTSVPGTDGQIAVSDGNGGIRFETFINRAEVGL